MTEPLTFITVHRKAQGDIYGSLNGSTIQSTFNVDEIKSFDEIENGTLIFLKDGSHIVAIESREQIRILLREIGAFFVGESDE